mmetsp:Transcript_145928/g.406518  ORF Transcript_145928/g.406518 Transcript_145928/m.406518 type:complete len:202 (-) Transcript_145928:424-1029(-)
MPSSRPRPLALSHNEPVFSTICACASIVSSSCTRANRRAKSSASACDRAGWKASCARRWSSSMGSPSSSMEANPLCCSASCLMHSQRSSCMAQRRFQSFASSAARACKATVTEAWRSASCRSLARLDSEGAAGARSAIEVLVGDCTRLRTFGLSCGRKVHSRSSSASCAWRSASFRFRSSSRLWRSSASRSKCVRTSFAFA